MKIYLLKNIELGGDLVILHFGLGLIGSAIYRALNRYECIAQEQVHKMSCSTDDLATFSGVLADVFTRLLDAHVNRVIILWSAGKTNFLSASDQTEAEFYLFQRYLRVSSEVVHQHFGLRPDVYLISSAGALHTGQTNVGLRTSSEPNSPYGLQKAAEEAFVANEDLFASCKIFRVSTVYTRSNVDMRRGMISTLMMNALYGRTTRIYGHPFTQRDYVLDADLAEYIVMSMLTASGKSRLAYLVSGKPTSIFELRTIVEQMLNKKLYLNYSIDDRNTASVTFSPRLRAPAMRTSDLRTNLKLLSQQLVIQGGKAHA